MGEKSGGISIDPCTLCCKRKQPFFMFLPMPSPSNLSEGIPSIFGMEKIPPFFVLIGYLLTVNVMFAK